MLPLKGTWKDSPLSKQPDGYTYEILNGTISKNLGGITNENGCEEHSESYNNLGYQQLGLYNAKGGIKIIFSKVSDNLDAIGIIDNDGNYTEKIRENLGFSIDHPVDCESYYNYKGELIIAFTDYYNTPKLINLDDIIIPFNINDIQLYTFFTQPQTVAEVLDNGGSLRTGAYFPFFSYRKDDTRTPYTSVENPIYITDSTLSEGVEGYDGAPANSPSGKAIKLVLNNVDTDYNFIILGCIIKIDGVLTTRIIKELPVTGTSMTINYLGSESFEEITLEEVLTPSAVYDRIKHFTQVNGVLYGAYTSEASPLAFQKYANLIKLKWTSELISPRFNLLETFKVNEQNNRRKGYKHEEVYGFYIRVKVKGRPFSQGFLISNRAPEGNETALYSTLGAGYEKQLSISNTAKFYQIDDTSGALGKFGYWENEDETYPNTEDFSPVNGSEDLRGKKIRHHRFPSIRKTKELLYAGNTEYGRNQLDILGIEIESFPTLPTELSDIIEGYQIYYAKRDVNNSTVNGQSLLLYNHKDQTNLSDSRVFWAGGNWGVELRINNLSPILPQFSSNREYGRFHSFDLLYDKPAISPSYMSSQIGMRANISNHVVRFEVGKYAFHLDYAVDSQDIGVPSNSKYHKLTDFKYIPASANVDNYVNIIGEEAAVAKIEGGGPTFVGQALRTSTTTSGQQQNLSFEETRLVNLMAYKTNIYNSFKDQQLISTGKYIKLTDSDRKIYGGDTNIGLFGFVTNSACYRAVLDNPYNNNSVDDPTKAIKVVRGFITESNNNLTLRHEVEGDDLTKYYPKQNIATNSAWFLDFSRFLNPNKIAYNRDYTSLNDLNPVTVFNEEDEFIAEDPYKIIRSRIPNKEEREPSWKIFLANDYYIIPRDKGFITNIQGVGENLFINCEQALLTTRGSEELATDSFKVVLGTGNIFDRPPVEMIFEETGYAGCQHKFSCLLTRFGYFFVDENRKKIFLVKDTVKDITGGLQDFFRNNLITTGDNPYREKGYTVAWDDEFSRIVLSSQEKEFTRHYYPELEAWNGRSNYFPNILLGNRNSMFAIKNGKIYKHNIKGIKGIYYDDTIHPFAVVMIMREVEKQITINNIQWRTLYILEENPIRDKTFDSVLLWNSYQATGDRVVKVHNSNIGAIQNYETSNTRRKKNIWNFNDIKNRLTVKDVKFIDDINIIPNTTNDDINFYLKKPLSDDYVAVKLLFFNEKIGILQAELQLLDFDINGNIVNR